MKSTNEETIIEAIEKVVKGGFKSKDADDLLFVLQDVKAGYMVGDLFYESIIFSIPFMKALFGEDMVCSKCDEPEGYSMENIHLLCYNHTFIPAWQYKGFEMLKSPDRIEYLRKFLKGGKG